MSTEPLTVIFPPTMTVRDLLPVLADLCLVLVATPDGAYRAVPRNCNKESNRNES